MFLKCVLSPQPSEDHFISAWTCEIVLKHRVQKLILSQDSLLPPEAKEKIHRKGDSKPIVHLRVENIFSIYRRYLDTTANVHCATWWRSCHYDKQCRMTKLYERGRLMKTYTTLKIGIYLVETSLLLIMPFLTGNCLKLSSSCTGKKGN